MNSIYTHQDANKRKTALLMVLFFIIVIGIGWAFSLYSGSPNILWFAVAISIIMNVGAYWFSDTLVIKMAGAKPVTRESHRELWNIVENLSITAGLPMPKLYVIDDQAPNAFATGRNPKHAALAVTDGILQLLDRSELEGVIAHELSHVGNRDMLLGTVAVVLVGFVAILANMFMRMSFSGSQGDRDSRAGALFFILGIMVAILAPLAAQLIHFAISRKREFLADASGVLLTRYPDGLASALQKIGAHAQPMRRANHATAHLFIADPFTTHGGFADRISTLFQTHPPIEERVNALRGR